MKKRAIAIVVVAVFMLVVTSTAFAYSSTINMIEFLDTRKEFRASSNGVISVSYGVLKLYQTQSSTVPVTDLPQHLIIKSIDQTQQRVVADRCCGTKTVFDSSTTLNVPSTNWQVIRFDNATETRYIKGPVTITADEERAA